LSIIFKHEKPDIVFHLAAEARVQHSIDDPQLSCSTNFIGTCNVLQASRESEVRRVVYSSTSSAYGVKNIGPLHEDMKRDCLNPYSISKVAGEDLCRVYYDIFGLETVILRYFNVYGDREPLKGIYAPVIGIFLKQSQNGEPMTIVGDGLQSRDFTHVRDVVNANMLASTTQNRKALGQIFNIGTGKNYTILEVSSIIGGECIHVPERQGEARHTLANLEKSKQVLGYEPTTCLKTYLKEKKNATVL
jgi:UDP-glucose 4-epimerase